MGKTLAQRRCIVCKTTSEKKDLLRFVKDKSGAVELNLSSKAPGRGAYVCKDMTCIDSAFCSSALSRALRAQIPKGRLSELKDMAINALSD